MSAKTPRGERLGPQDWLNGAIELLAEGGVKSIKVEALAKRLGVTKGSFYWHFQNRSALLEALVSMWESQGTDRLITEVTDSGSEPRAQVRLLWKYATQGPPMTAELALREWGRVDPLIRARVAAVDNRRLDFVKGLFVQMGRSETEAQARSFLLYSMLIGEHFIQLGGRQDLRSDLIHGAIDHLLA